MRNALEDGTIPTCSMYVRVPDSDTEWMPCPHPAPDHGVTMSGDGVVAERKPICDEHHDALVAGQRDGFLPGPPPGGE